jgi:transcriptional regulator with XRE-family HTH domain
MNQASVGDLIGKSASQMSKYELGKNRITATNYEKLQRELAPESSRLAGFSESQAEYNVQAFAHEDEVQFLNRIIGELKRRRDERGRA